MPTVASMRYFLLLALTVFSTGVLASKTVAGDETAGEALVSWKAVVDKVSKNGGHGYTVKVKLDFQGRTSEGNQIRGTGKLRFVSDPNEVFTIGDPLRGSDSLRYWATVKSTMGEDLAIIQGTGILNFAATDSVLTIEGAVEFKAALEIYNGG